MFHAHHYVSEPIARITDLRGLCYPNLSTLRVGHGFIEQTAHPTPKYNTFKQIQGPGSRIRSFQGQIFINTATSYNNEISATLANLLSILALFLIITVFIFNFLTI